MDHFTPPPPPPPAFWRRAEHLLNAKLVSKTSDLYHHPDSFYALDVCIHLIKKHTGLQVERVHKQGLNNPKGKNYLIASAAHCRCVVRYEYGGWVIKDNRQTYPVVQLSQHVSGAVYQVGDQFTETPYDRKIAIERERPSHSPAKEHEFPGNEGKTPAPHRQNTVFRIAKINGAKLTDINRNPNLAKATPSKKKQLKKKCTSAVNWV